MAKIDKRSNLPALATAELSDSLYCWCTYQILIQAGMVDALLGQANDKVVPRIA